MIIISHELLIALELSLWVCQIIVCRLNKRRISCRRHITISNTLIWCTKGIIVKPMVPCDEALLICGNKTSWVVIVPDRLSRIFNCWYIFFVYYWFKVWGTVSIEVRIIDLCLCGVNLLRCWFLLWLLKAKLSLLINFIYLIYKVSWAIHFIYSNYYL